MDTTTKDPIGLGEDTLAVTVAAHVLADTLGVDYLTALAILEATECAP